MTFKHSDIYPGVGFVPVVVVAVVVGFVAAAAGFAVVVVVVVVVVDAEVGFASIGFAVAG